MTTSQIVPPLYGVGIFVTAAFAAWARRFLRDAREADLSSSEARSLAMRKLQYASFVATLAQLGTLVALLCAKLFAGEHGLWKPGAFFFAMVVLQGQVRFAVEKRLRDLPTTQLEMLRLSLRTLFAMALLYGIYLLVALGGIHGAGAALARLPLTGGWRALATWGSSPLSVLAGIFAIGYLSPVLIRLMMPCDPVTDPEVIGILESCFARAGLPAPAFWTLRMDRHKRHNAMVTGLSFGRGPFRRSLYFTRSLLERLERREFEAIMLHEISHIALHHIRNRLLFSVFAFVVSLLPMSAITMAALLFLPGRYATLVPVLAYVLMLVTQALVIRWLVRRQELEADAHGVLSLGGDAEAFASAMRKLLALNDALADRKDPGSFLNAAAAHPTAEYRIRVLREKAEKKARGERVLSPFEEFRVALARRAVVWGPALALLGAVTALCVTKRLLPVHRLVEAAAEGDLARIETLGQEADVDARDWLANGETPLFAAVSRGQGAAARRLVERFGAGVNVAYRGWAPLHVAAMQGDVATAAVLLDHGAHVDAVTRHRSTALGIAAERGHARLVEMLLRHGANPNLRDADGDSPLGMARGKAHGEIVRLLERAGARDEH